MKDIDVDRAVIFSAKSAAQLVSAAVKSRWTLEGLVEQEPEIQESLLHFLTKDRPDNPSVDMLEMVVQVNVDRLCAFLERVTGDKPSQESPPQKLARETALNLFKIDTMLPHLELRLIKMMNISLPSDERRQSFESMLDRTPSPLSPTPTRTYKTRASM